MSPARIVPIEEPPTRQRRPRRSALVHLAWIRTLPCLVTGQRGNVDAAHIRYGDRRLGKPAVGMGEKPEDRWTVPLLHSLHVGDGNSQHANGEKSWWQSHGIDPVVVALALFGATGDTELALGILQEARKR